MSEEAKNIDTAASQGSAQAGRRTFWGTLAVLIMLVVAYAVSHAVTFQQSGYLHYEAADVIGERRDLLVTLSTLEEQLETPSAVAAPAVGALLHDLEQSVLQAETSDEVTDLFETASQQLARLGIQEDVSPKILAAAQSRAVETISASEEEREVPKRLFQAELEIAEAWALDALGAPAVLERAEQLAQAAEGLGYDAGSDVGETLADVAQELKTERPNRRLVAEMMGQVADELRGPQSLFWSHTALRWLEVMAWSLAGMLLVRLWSIGKYIATGKFNARWNFWWWAKIIQAPLLAVGVVLALTYFELGVASGETLGFQVSLRDQPMELVVAISLILGMFSDRAYGFLTELAGKVLPERESVPGEEDRPEDGEEEAPGQGGAG
jgi:hypothetical protein